MKILICHIIIGSLTFKWVNNLEVESAFELFTDTAMIKLPAHLKINKDELLNYINFGDKVIVKVGYNNNLTEIFSGYVTDIKPSLPIEIACEDEMWKLKQETVTASGRNMTVGKLLKQYYASYTHKYLDVQLGTFYIDNLNKVKILEQLKSDFGLFSFFRDDTLYVGLQYDPDIAQKHTFVLDYNIADDSLEFKRKEQVKLKVKAVSNNKDGSKTEIELGDESGDQRTLNFYNLTKSQLQEHATRELERLKYDGWRGDFTAFGEPLVKHGDIVKLKKLNDEKSEKSGEYWVDKVVYSFGVDGFRQKITLGPKV
jgi:hypothetical protein